MSAVSARRSTLTADDATLAAGYAQGRVVVMNDDADLLAGLAELFALEGYACEIYGWANEYLNVLGYNRPCLPGPSCVLSDVCMPERDGLDGLDQLELQHQLSGVDDTPMLLTRGSSTLNEAVSGFRQVAVDFLGESIPPELLLETVRKALAISTQRRDVRERESGLVASLAYLTGKERHIASAVAAGDTSVTVATNMDVSKRSIKLHRHSIFLNVRRLKHRRVCSARLRRRALTAPETPPSRSMK